MSLDLVAISLVPVASSLVSVAISLDIVAMSLEPVVNSSVPRTKTLDPAAWSSVFLTGTSDEVYQFSNLSVKKGSRIDL
jgi:hypothetical protein